MKDFDVVKMEDVPTPPPTVRKTRWGTIYTEMRKLGLGERHALRVPFNGAGALAFAKTRLRKIADADGLTLCTSRTADSKLLYCWLAKP